MALAIYEPLNGLAALQLLKVLASPLREGGCLVLFGMNDFEGANGSRRFDRAVVVLAQSNFYVFCKPNVVTTIAFTL